MFDFLDKLNEGKEFWAKVFDGQEASFLQVKEQVSPLADLKTAMLGEEKLEVTAARKPALQILLNNPQASKSLTALVTSSPEAKTKLTEIFKNGTEEQITALAKASLEGNDKVTSLLNIKQVATQTAPTQPLAASSSSPEREAALIDTVLTAATSKKGATDIAKVPGVKFHTGNGQYAENHVTDDSITQVSITNGGKTRYFKQIEKVDSANSPTGFKASAWVETDSRGNYLANKSSQLWLCYPGYEGKPGDNSPETKSTMAVGDGKLNPQTAEVPAFVNNALAKVDQSRISAINIGAHSLGASNALTSQVVLDAKGVPAKTTLLVEPAGATLAHAKIGESLADKNSALSQAIAQSGASLDKAAEAVQKIDRNTVSIRSVVVNGGNVDYSNTAMLIPGGDRLKNASISVNGRQGSVDSANEMVGNKVYINMTGANNLAQAQHDATHSATNISNALQSGAALGAKPAAAASGTASANPSNSARFEKIIDQNPRFGEIVKKIYTNLESQSKGAKIDPELQSLVEDVMKHPEKLEPVAKLVQNNPQFATTIENTIGSGTPNKHGISMLKNMINKPELVDQAQYALTKNPDFAGQILDLGTKYPYLGMYITQNALAGKSGTTQQEIQGNLDARLETVRILNENPAFAIMANGIAEKAFEAQAKGEKADEGSKQLISELTSNTASLEAAAKLIQKHPAVANIVTDGINGGANNPQTIENMRKILSDPAQIEKIDKAFSENADMAALMSGSINKGQIMADLPGFLQRNPTLLDFIQTDDPTIKPLIMNSSFAKDNPQMMKLMQDKGVTNMMAAIFGGNQQDGQGGSIFGDGEGEEQEEGMSFNPFESIENQMLGMLVNALVKMFGGENTEIGKMATQLFAGNSQQPAAAQGI